MIRHIKGVNIHLYDRVTLIEVLEINGYVKSDIQRQHVAGDLLQFAMSILIAEKLDKLLGKLDSGTNSYKSVILTPAEKKEVKDGNPANG